MGILVHAQQGFAHITHILTHAHVCMHALQSEIMDMKEELIGDTIDDAIGADEEDEER